MKFEEAWLRNFERQRERTQSKWPGPGTKIMRGCRLFQLVRAAVAAVALGTLPLAGNGVAIEDQAAATQDADNAGDDLAPFFIVDTKRFWPSTTIAVCWTQKDPKYIAQRSWVEAAVKTFIEANSAFKFGKDWPECQSNLTSGIRITVSDSAAESEVGYKDNGGIVSPTHMNLNFDFQRWNTDCAVGDRKQRCIQTIAVHEFMHALGALHEQLSKDLMVKDHACWLKYKDTADIRGVSPLALTAYDPDSIMNYCKDIYATPTHLSALDLKGLKTLSDRTEDKSKVN